MSEGGKHEPTRRSLLKQAFFGIAGYALGRLIKSQALPSADAKQTADSPPPQPQPKISSQAAPEQKIVSEPKQEAIQPQETSLLFPNTSSGEEKQAKKMVQKQVEHYNSPSFKESIKNTLRWKGTIAISAQNLGLGTDSPLSQLLLAIIFVESQGDPKAVAKDVKENTPQSEIATGLCQIKLSTAQQAARELGMNISYDDLFKPETNILLSLSHLRRLHKVFPDPSLAIWTYNMGDTPMVEAIEEYLVSDLGENRSKTQSSLNNPNEGSAFLIKKYGLNFIKLISSKNVVSKLKEMKAFSEEVQLYVPRVAAAALLLNTS